MTYQSWSGLWMPPEHMLTVDVGRGISRLDGVAWAMLDGKLRQQAGHDVPKMHRLDLPGHVEDVPDEDQFDIVVWDDKRLLVGVVEVKVWWVPDGEPKFNDVERICHQVSEGRNFIRWGILAYMFASLDRSAGSQMDSTESEGTKDVVSWSENVAVSAAEVAEDHGLTLTRHRCLPRREDGGAWVAEVFTFSL